MHARPKSRSKNCTSCTKACTQRSRAPARPAPPHLRRRRREGCDMRIDAAYKARLFRMRSSDISQRPADGSPDLVVVQFNPNSLSYSAQNTLEKKGRDAAATQFVAQTTAKLEFDLIFDSTHDGADVRKETDKIKRFLDPGTSAKEPAPPMVGFAWGSFTFKGFLESFRETIDFFSAEGVPLRSTVKVSLSSLSSRDAFLQQKFAEGKA